MASLFDKLYEKSPLWLQNLGVSLYGVYWHWLRFGGNYPEHEAGYRHREFFNAADWEEYQVQKLPQLLTSASEHVPYYRSAWSDKQKRAAREGKLQALPLLEKEPLRKNPEDFLRDDMRRVRYWTFHTSGSTGTPIATIWTTDEIRDSLAVREVRSANWAGVSFTQPRATFSGRLIEPDPDSKGPYFRFNRTEKQVYLSPFHLKPDTAHFYVSAFRKHKIQWLTGYAISYYLLAKFILKTGLEPPALKAVITTSEKVTPEMRKVMEQAYGCRVFEEYSTVENALFASECEHGKLHVSPDVGIVEILREDGTNCAPGEIGEVVTTCFRASQPMIRYRLGDLAAWDASPCSCGRSMPVIKEVVGRIEDVVVGPDGRQMVRFHGIFVNQPHIIEGQIIQEAINHIHVKVVPSECFRDSDVQEIVNRVQNRLGKTVQVSVEKVDKIPRSASGKFKAVISKIH